MFRVYILGAYSSPNSIQLFKNIGQGEKMAAELFKLGFAPFSPWQDRNYIITNPDHSFDIQKLIDCSLEWLKVSDCTIQISSECSSWHEKARTIIKELNIPIFYNKYQLIEWSQMQRCKNI